MSARTETGRVVLSPRGSLMLEEAAGAELTCVRGCVWLTQYGDIQDVVLQPGQTFVPSLPSVLAMASSGAAELLVRRPAASRKHAGRQRWWRRLAGLLDPRWDGRVRRELAERVRAHRVA